MFWPFALFFGSLLTSLLITPAVRRAATRAQLLDLPDTRRKVHGSPVPRLGGVGVAGCFYLAMAALALTNPSPSAAAALRLLGACFWPSVIVLGLGILDDIRSVRPIQKVLVELAAASWVCWNGIYIGTISIPLGNVSLLGALSVPLTICWIILITNAFNIVDGMDGLASGVAFIAVTCLFVASIQRSNDVIPLIAAPLAGALLGFLRYNFNPASIFLGDSGSLWIGFMLAVASIVGYQKSSIAIAISAPLLTLALPLLEVGTSTARRFLSGQRIWLPDAAHIHHQLLRRGLTMKQAVIVLYVGSAVFGGASLFLARASDSAVGVTALGLAVVAWLGVQRLGYAEFVEVQHAFKRGFFYQRRIIQNNIQTRRLAIELEAAPPGEAAWNALVRVAMAQGFERVQLIRTMAQSSLESEAGGAAERRWLAREWMPPTARDGLAAGPKVAVHLYRQAVKIGELLITLPSDEFLGRADMGLLMSAVAKRGACFFALEDHANGEDRVQTSVGE